MKGSHVMGQPEWSMSPTYEVRPTSIRSREPRLKLLAKHFSTFPRKTGIHRPRLTKHLGLGNLVTFYARSAKRISSRRVPAFSPSHHTYYYDMICQIAS